jgi:hypothetical protein
MRAEEVTRFLSALAVEGRVSSSTQNQALSALLFLYGPVLGVELPWLDELVRAAHPQRLPVVLSRDEVRVVLLALRGTTRLLGSCTAPAFASWSAPGSASTTSTSQRIRSSCGAGRVITTG